MHFGLLSGDVLVVSLSLSLSLWAQNSGHQAGPGAREVALDYVRSMGCARDEIIFYGVDGVLWRRAVYRAEGVNCGSLDAQAA
jgi:hypothetical protein